MGRPSRYGVAIHAPIKRWKAGLYVRLSKEDNDKSFSIENQTMRLNNFVNANEDDFESIKYYIDSGASGSNSQREAFSSLLDDLRRSAINCVIVKDLSRLSRNYYEAGYYLEYLFVSMNTRFISLEYPSLDSYKFPDLMNNVMVPMQNVVNDDFCRQTSIKVKNILRMKMEKGEFIGAFAPYGYIKSPSDRHQLLVDKEAADIVWQIFNWFANDNLSQNGIVHKLNSLGIPTPSSRKKALGLTYRNPQSALQLGGRSLWHIRTVGIILTNETYLGNLVQGKAGTKHYRHSTIIQKPREEWVIVKGTHQAIINQEIFQRAQDLLSRDTRIPAKGQLLHLFSGFLRCADCGRGMVRKASRGYTYYSCRTHTTLSKTACTKHTINGKHFVAAVDGVIRLLARIFIDTRKIDSLIKSQISCIPVCAWSGLIVKKKSEVERLSLYIKSLYPDWKNGNLSKQEYLMLKKDYQQEILQLEKEIQNLKHETAEDAQAFNNHDIQYKHFLVTGHLPELTRSIIAELIDVIFIGQDENITIRFRCKDPFLNAIGN